MVGAWSVNGLCMVCTVSVLGIYMVCAWYVHGSVCAWDVYTVRGMCMVMCIIYEMCVYVLCMVNV